MTVIDTYFPGPTGLPTIDKRAGEKLDYSLDLEEYLVDIDATIQSATVELGATLTKEGDVGHDSYTVTVPKVAGGVVGQFPTIKYLVTLAGSGEVVVREVALRII